MGATSPIAHRLSQSNATSARALAHPKEHSRVVLGSGVQIDFADVNEPEILNTDDIRSIHSGLKSLSPYFATFYPYHSLLPLSPSFGPGQHVSLVLSGLIRAVSLLAGQESDRKLEREIHLCLRIEALLSNWPLFSTLTSEVMPVLIWDPTYFDSVRLSRSRFRCISSVVRYVDQDDVRSNLLAFFKQVVEHVDSTTGPLALPGMEFLWIAGQELMNFEDHDRSYALDPNIETIDSLLPTLYNPFTSKPNGKPNNLHELGLVNHWFPQIVEICREDPAGVLEGNLLDSMIRFYEDDGYKDAKPYVEEFPGSINPTWLEILLDLEQQCELAVEHGVEHSPITSASTEADPAVRDRDKDDLDDCKRDTESNPHLLDGSF